MKAGEVLFQDDVEKSPAKKTPKHWSGMPCRPCYVRFLFLRASASLGTHIQVRRAIVLGHDGAFHLQHGWCRAVVDGVQMPHSDVPAVLAACRVPSPDSSVIVAGIDAKPSCKKFPGCSRSQPAWQRHAIN